MTVTMQGRLMCDQIDSDPRKKWPKNLQVRPKAEMKRKGYDVLGWKDDL